MNVLQSASNVGKTCPSNTSWGDFTSNLTHLHLESKGIRSITNLESCYAVRVLYLYSNRIDRISGLENLRQLTHLYLQVLNPCIARRVHSTWLRTALRMSHMVHRSICCE